MCGDGSSEWGAAAKTGRQEWDNLTGVECMLPSGTMGWGERAGRKLLEANIYLLIFL